MKCVVPLFSALQSLNIDKAADGISKITTGMVKIAIAAVILNLAVKAFGKMKPKVMLQGLAGIATGIFAMSLAVKALDEAVTRAEEKYCYKICAGIYEGRQHA